MGQSSAESIEAPLIVFKTGSIHDSCNSLILAGCINGKTCDITIDTGSNISIVRADFLTEEDKRHIQPVNSCLQTVTGERAPIHGRGNLVLKIGSLNMPHQMWVADIQDKCILGLDFLERHDCLVNIKDSSLRVGQQEFPLRKSNAQQVPSCYRVTLANHISIPPLSEAIVPVRIEGVSDAAQWGMLECPASDEEDGHVDGVLIGRTLVDMQKKTTPLRVMNLTRESKVIRRGALLACCEPIVSVVTSKSSRPPGRTPSVTRRTVLEELPSHIEPLFQRCVDSLTATEKDELHQLLCQFSDLFSTGSNDLGCTELVRHEIHTGDAKPIRQPPRRLPLARREEAENILSEMREQGVIEPSASAWSSPVVLVRKKDGSTRFCIDYRRLNDVTTKDSYPLPRIDDTIDSLAGANWFSTLDLKSGYWQVQLSEEARCKTAFSTGTGLWQFKVMPFGLCNAPATFERLMEQVLAGLPTTVALLYLDDILVPGRTFRPQMDNLQMVFRRLREANLKLNPRKCNLFQKEVKYLGHVVSAKGVSPDPEKVEAIQAWPRPMSSKDLKSFLGLASYYRRFIPGFADIAVPLHHCAKKMTTFVWSIEEETAFTKLKTALSKAPVLAYPDPALPFLLDTDASSTGIGAVLSQVTKGKERPVAYFSSTLNQSQRNYCVTRRELLAVVKAVKQFHPYLYGQKFLLRTDHSALQWLLSFRQPEGQVARWLEALQGYNFTVEHRPGLKHANADALSRRPCLNTGCGHCEKREATEWLHQESVPDTTSNQENTTLPVRAVTLDASNIATITESPEELRQAQRNDETLRPVIQWLETSANRPSWEEVAPGGEYTKAYWAQWDSLRLVDGVLYRLWETPCGDAVVKQLVIPKLLQKRVLQELHGSVTVGHFGIAKTLGRVRQRFFWVNCREDVQEWCRNCDLCAEKRGPPRRPRAPMRQYLVGAPMERLALDILGPLPTSNLGNKYILIVADYFSKWIEAFPMPNQEAHTVAELLVKEVVCRFGVPLLIHSDQGRNFESAVFTEMCQLLGIQKTRTTAYHPQSDGMVERFNRTLEDQLAKFVDYHQRDWDEHIPYLMLAYRSAVHESTGCTPAKVVFGRDLRLPIDLLIGRPVEEVLGPAVHYTEELCAKLERVHHFARDHLKMTSDKMKQRYDLLQSGSSLMKGDPVWLHNPQRKKGLSPKLQRSWQGPYVVTKKINDLIYRIQLAPYRKPKVVHRNRLWLYTGANPPTWFRAIPGNATATPTDELDTNTRQPTLVQEYSTPEGNPEQQPRRSSRQRRPPDRYGAGA